MITFSEFSVGTYITNQYESEGIIFSGISSTPEIFPDGANPTSPILEGGPSYTGDIAAQFVLPGTTSPGIVNTFSLDVGYIDSPGSTEVEVYGNRGQLLGTIPVNAYGIVHVTSKFAGASSFLVHAVYPDPAGFAIDNVEFPTPTGGGGTGRVSLVGMGDSYSAGEANPPFIDPDGCHRSNAAYAPQIAAANGWTLTDFTACGGATTKSFMTTGQNHEHAQIAQLESDIAADKPVDAMTLTLGGNDIGFSAILRYCLFTDFVGSDPGYQSEFPPSPQAPVDCASDNNFANAVTTTIENEANVVVDAYRQLAQIAGTNASVMAADYPHIFSSEPSAQTCFALSIWDLTKNDQNWFNGLTDLLDEQLQDAAQAAGINFIDVRPIFNGHAICDGSHGDDAWINAVTDVDGFFNFDGSFHPKASGQIGYADAFVQYINDQRASGAPLTPDGLPQDPADPPSDQPSPTSPLTLGTITITPPVDQPNCPDVVQGGEIVTISGDGFAPGANLTLKLAGQGANGKVQALDLGRQTAGSDGTFSTTVRLPLGLVGFTPTGTSTAVVYIQATGAGADSTNRLDNQLLNLAPHGSSCGTVSPLPFQGFSPPVSNPPTVNLVNPGSTVPVKFAVPEVPGTVADVLAPGYPQSVPVSCANPGAPTSGTPTTANSNGSQSGASDQYNYTWATDPSWTGCRELIVELADGSVHDATFNFSKQSK